MSACNLKCTEMCSNQEVLDYAKLERKIRELVTEFNKAYIHFEGDISTLKMYLENNLPVVFREYIDKLDKTGELDKLITSAVNNSITALENKVGHIVNLIEYADCCTALGDFTEAFKEAIKDANQKGRVLFVPKGHYLIRESIVLNGCSLIGESVNIFSEDGVVIECLSDDFTAISQGSVKASDVMFNIQNITVKGANVGFEINYAINSTFENLYAIDCETAYKLGDPDAVGSMFCEFKSLYTKNCQYGIVIDAKEYFNNNIFTGGYIYGEKVALKMKVTGGYGAVGNTFNNVELKSPKGRGSELTSCYNTIFNSCYFECGANTIYCENFSYITLNDCTYAMFKADNEDGDNNVIFANGGLVLTVNGGVIFLDDNYQNVYFFGCNNSAVYENIRQIASIVKVGQADGFDFYSQSIQ